MFVLACLRVSLGSCGPIAYGWTSLTLRLDFQDGIGPALANRSQSLNCQPCPAGATL
jgi:hypothetical protein